MSVVEIALLFIIRNTKDFLYSSNTCFVCHWYIPCQYPFFLFTPYIFTLKPGNPVINNIGSMDAILFALWDKRENLKLTIKVVVEMLSWTG
jgi:hypothetical protein